jgi:soluble lytic murein transglycosylase-like protein
VAAIVVPVLAPFLQAQSPEALQRMRDMMQRNVDRQRAAVTLMRDSIRRQQGSAGVPATRPADLTLTAGGFDAGAIDCPPVPESDAGLLVQTASERAGIDADLLYAVAQQESDFRPCAVSAKGALGVMQLMPATAERFGVRDPFDPGQSINIGARLLRELLDRYRGDLTLALGAYNAGPARVDAAGGVPAIPETVNYVNQILRRLQDSR